MSKFKGSALKKKTFSVYLECLGEEVKLALNMSALLAIEEAGDSLEGALKKIEQNDIKSVVSVIAALITAGEGEECTPEWILNNFEIEDYYAVGMAMKEEFSNSDRLKKLMEKVQ